MGNLVKVTYHGKTPKTVQRPIPLISQSLRYGEVVFNPTAQVTEEEAEYLCSLGGAFTREHVTPKRVPNVHYHPEKFKTEKEAERYILEHGVAGRPAKCFGVYKIMLRSAMEDQPSEEVTHA